jgi:uncharacterized coiled-coil DUF342 family protein
MINESNKDLLIHIKATEINLKEISERLSRDVSFLMKEIDRLNNEDRKLLSLLKDVMKQKDDLADVLKKNKNDQNELNSDLVKDIIFLLGSSDTPLTYDPLRNPRYKYYYHDKWRDCESCGK